MDIRSSRCTIDITRSRGKKWGGGRELEITILTGTVTWIARGFHS